MTSYRLNPRSAIYAACTLVILGCALRIACVL